MAWAIQTIRGGGYLTFNTSYQPVNGDIITWGGSVDSSTATWQFFVNTYTSGNDWISLSAGKLYMRVNGVSKTGTTVVADGTYFEFKLEVTATEYICYIDNIEQFRFSTATVIDPILGLSHASAALGVSSKAQFLTVAGKHNWDATASDHSAGSQPILTDTIGGNDATGVNFPTDGSAWVDLGGGGYTLAIDGGVYSYSGSPVNLLHNRTLSTDGGSYSYSGAALSLLYNRSLAIDGGVYSYSGQSIPLLHNRILSTDGGVYSYTGSAVTLTYSQTTGYTLAIDGGVYTSSGGNASLLHNRLLNTDGGIYAYSGGNVNTLYNRALSADGGDYNYSGVALPLLYNRNLTTSGGVYSYSGGNVTLNYSGQTTLLIDCYSVEFKQDELTIDYSQDNYGINYGCV